MKLLKAVDDYVEFQSDKLFKTTLFQSDALLLGLNCLEPGQVQQAHQHTDQDKFYFILEGSGRFWLGSEQVEGAKGDVIWAPAGLDHGVETSGSESLTLLVGIAPAP